MLMERRARQRGEKGVHGCGVESTAMLKCIAYLSDCATEASVNTSCMPGSTCVVASLG